MGLWRPWQVAESLGQQGGSRYGAGSIPRSMLKVFLRILGNLAGNLLAPVYALRPAGFAFRRVHLDIRASRSNLHVLAG